MRIYFNLLSILLYNQGMAKYFTSLFFMLVAVGFLSAEEHHIRIARENTPTVVAVNVAKKDGSTFTGTGFFLTPDGLLATNRHVCEDSLYVNITDYQGTVSGEAKIVAVAQNVDLALLKIEAQNLPTVRLDATSPVLPGQDITVIGNPRRLQNTISAGLVSQVRQKADGIIWYQISAPISPSSSGSPVFNTDGEVIAVAFASLKGEDNQNLNFAVPADYLLQLVTATGYRLPPPPAPRPDNTPKVSANPLVRHVQKSWNILKRLLGFESRKAHMESRA